MQNNLAMNMEKAPLGITGESLQMQLTGHRINALQQQQNYQNQMNLIGRDGNIGPNGREQGLSINGQQTINGIYHPKLKQRIPT